MYSRFQLARKFIQYYLTASNSKGHGIHSPFVYNFTKNILNNDLLYNAYRDVEFLRHDLLNDQRILEVNDLGAGSGITKNRKRKIADIARHTSKPRKYSQLLFRLSNYYQPGTIIELGTSLGISTAYLAKGNNTSKLITIEGAKEVSAIAQENFRKLKLDNITLLEGSFDKILPGLLEHVDNIDMAFIDGNHRREPTIEYFLLLLGKLNSSSILIFDDIHWSREMEEAWETIKNHPSVKTTIDLFFMGLVFLKDEFKVKQHFVIRF